MDAEMLALPPAAEAPRPRTLMVGTVLASASSVMFFFALFGIYISQRQQTRAAGIEWFPEGAIRLPPGGMMMMTLVLSAGTMAWVQQAIKNDDRRSALIALAITMIFGGSVINQTVFYWNDMQIGINDNPLSDAAMLMFTITGAHMLMVIVGLVFIFLTAMRALFGQYNSQQADGIHAAAFFWYSVIAVYSVIWFAIYITK